MPVESLFDRLEDLLPQVSKPIQYVGGELNSTIKDWDVAGVLGDGEQAVLEITDVVTAWKQEGRPGGRDELLMRLARTGGVYVPAFYDVHYLPDGRIQRVVPNRHGVPWGVSKHTVMDLD